jgi:hypothetical protein
MKTHCTHGHELTEENVYIRKNGERECRECMRARDKARYPARKKQVIIQATQWKKDHPEEFKASQAKQELRPEVKERRAKFYQETKNAMWRRYSVLKSKAKTYHQDFTLTQEDYEKLVIENSCFYCNGPLPEAGYGIDRQNNKLGYVHGNCVPCCEICNEKKGRLEGLGLTYPRTVEILLEILGKKP